MVGLLIMSAALAAPPHVADAPPRTPAEELASFTVPAGFEVQLVAAEPEITKPVNLAFDARGRLWVTCTVDYPFPAANGVGNDTVRILSEFGPDGRARSVRTFADRLTIPIGIQPYRDGAIVYSVAQLAHLRDTDGDGVCDRRDVLYSGFGYRDTHGMVNGLLRGFDGWIYANHGFANDSAVRGADGHEVRMNSGSVFRFRPDGSRVELVARGQVNPFGSCMDKWGNLFTACCHSKPITRVMRGAVYESFAKPHDGLGFGPAMVHEYRGSTALCGLAWYEANEFPPEYRQRFYLGDVVNNCINSFSVAWSGATPRARQLDDLLKSTDPWFRPVDIKLGPDGALYVADFYNRIIGHYEVPLDHPGRDRVRGRIWRIVRKPAPSAATDRRAVDDASLRRDLNSPNIAVRFAALHQLQDRGASLPAGDVPEGEHVARVWLNRPPRGGAIVPPGASPLVVVHALRRAGADGPPEPEALATLTRWATDEDPRAAYAAIEQIAARADSVAWLAVAADCAVRYAGEPTLGHAAKIALRDALGRVDPVALPRPHAWSAVADAALGLPSPRGAAWVARWMREIPDAAPAPGHIALLARFGDESVRPTDLIRRIEAIAADAPSRQRPFAHALLDGLREGGRSADPATVAWAGHLARAALASDQLGEIRQGLELAAKLTSPELDRQALRLALDRDRPEPVRVAVIGAIAARAPGPVAGRLADASEPMPVREAAARGLGQLNQPEARAALVDAIAAAPSRLSAVIAEALVAAKPGAEQLCEVVERGKASPRLLAERSVRAKLDAHGLKDRVERLTAGLPPADRQTEELVARRRAAVAQTRADLPAGRELFARHCGVCHQVAGQGAKIGPQLDGIGARGLDRLLEDVLDPSRNVDPAFRQSTVHLDDGRIVSGLVLREDARTLTIADGQGKEIALDRGRIEHRAASALSAMPANAGETMNEHDFALVMHYLLSLTGTGSRNPPR